MSSEPTSKKSPRYRYKYRNKQEIRDALIDDSEINEPWTRSTCTDEGCVCAEMNKAVDEFRFWQPKTFIERAMKQNLEKMAVEVLSMIDDEYFEKGWEPPKL